MRYGEHPLFRQWEKLREENKITSPTKKEFFEQRQEMKDIAQTILLELEDKKNVN